jgi:DNA-binding NarL/FixJ family response regulator
VGPGGVRAVVADDHPVFRSGLRLLLEDLGVEVVAEAADGGSAVDRALEHRPDVVLMDLQMPGVSGLEATRRLTQAAPDVRVLVLTMVEDDDTLYAALRAGAAGYLLKGAGPDEIDRAVRGVAAGDAVYGAGVADRLRRMFAAGPAPVAFPQLVERERDVLDLLATGASNADIARRLYLSDKTVRNYVSSILAKLGVRDRSQAIVRAREAGLGVPAPEPGESPAAG